MKTLRHSYYIVVLLFAFSFTTSIAFSQSITSGDITGVITDPTGAVVPNATVTATSDTTAQKHTATTNAQGFYRFSFLPPGPYTVSASASGFQAANRKVVVVVGQASSANIALAVSSATTTVEVTTSPLQVDNADNSTTFGTQQIDLVPNPGNDLSAVVQASPGVTMNTQGGFGNFSTYGLPGTSNLFTVDGQNDNDPFLNLNNSGATNLLLGANDIQQATVTNNGYSGQYGQLAGSQVNYVTKSGGNDFHGNATYFWNGRVLNANNYLNNLAIAGTPSTPKPFDNVNQWAIGVGGPIVKDKTFFFFNYEGLRVVIPTSNSVAIPSPAFQAATLANVATNNPAALPFYQTIFNLYNGAQNASSGVPGDCSPDNFTPPPNLVGNCNLTFQNTATNFTHEYQMSLKIDQKFSDKDSLFGRVETDRGIQATITDPINPIFNTQSNQPQYQGQLGETHFFSPNLINELKASGSWYSAIFDNANRAATLSVFPTTIRFFGGDFSRMGGFDNDFPQGRNVTQYQLVDDVSLNKGNHTMKFGVNYRRYDVTDFDYGAFTSGEAITSAESFFNGTTDLFVQNFPSRLTQPIALYGLGFYGQDEWRATNKLKVTLSLRLDHNSNPVCQTNCFAELNGPFTSLDHTNSENIPYNQTIRTGLHQAYPGTDIVVWQPRLGFAFSPFSSNKTVIRGGIGIFGDSFPAVLVDNLSSNPPVLNSFTVTGNLGPAGTPQSMFDVASQANQSFVAGFNNGATMLQIANANPFFFPPSLTAADTRVRQPRYQEWNLEVQQDVGWNTVASVNYVGNHGIFEPVLNSGVNAFFDPNPKHFPTGFAGLPAQRLVAGIPVGPDARFSAVTEIQSSAVSNYNGLVTSLRHQFNRGFAFQLNYTWSHALDEISNGGLLPFNDLTNVSPLNPFNPFNIRANYGNADYDVRHYFSANYVWDNSLRHLFHWGPNAVFSGWTVSGTIFSRSGLPFTVIDGNTSAFLQGDNFGSGVVPAQIVGGTTLGGCGKANATPDATTGNVNPCLDGNGFASPAGLAFNQARNQFRGPSYFNTDLSIMKNTKLTERTSLGIGFQFFNLFNHPNFDQPVNDIGAFAGPGTPASPRDFGTIISTVNTPTSILGSFLGGDASPRLIQLKAEFKF